MLAITGASAALALSEIPFEKTIAGVRVGLVNGSYVINPTYRRAQEEPARPDRRRQQRRHRDGRSRRQGSDRSRRSSARSKRRTPRSRQIVAAIDELKAAAGKKKLRAEGREIDPAFHAEVEAKMFGPLADAMRIKDKLDSYGRSTACWPT